MILNGQKINGKIMDFILLIHLYIYIYIYILDIFVIVKYETCFCFVNNHKGKERKHNYYAANKYIKRSTTKPCDFHFSSL